MPRSTEQRRKKQVAVGLRELARLASVDMSTVSRALNHDPRIAEERGAQIRQLAEKMGYRPRPLRAKHAGSVGLLLQSDARGGRSDFLERIAWSAQRLLAERRLHANLECIGRDTPMKTPAIVQQNRVDGVLLGGHPPAELVASIRALGMPAVAINDSVERLKISCVRSDPKAAIRQAILNLAARGHESFALLMGSLEYPTAQARHDSYLEALREIRIDPQPAWLVADLPSEIAGGRAGVRELQERGALPTAILCENDWLALGAMQELQRQRIRIPQDVSVVGHDDVWICEQLEPTLTTIHRAEDELVTKAIDLLLEEIRTPGTEPREVLVQGELIWRQSAGPAPERLKAVTKTRPSASRPAVV